MRRGEDTLTETEGSVITLPHIEKGSQARIVKCSPLPAYHRKRLLAMGLIPGAVLTLLHIAPLGEPFIIGIIGTKLMLSRQEAEGIWVEVIPSCV